MNPHTTTSNPSNTVQLCNTMRNRLARSTRKSKKWEQLHKQVQQKSKLGLEQSNRHTPHVQPETSCFFSPLFLCGSVISLCVCFLCLFLSSCFFSLYLYFFLSLSLSLVCLCALLGFTLFLYPHLLSLNTFCFSMCL